MDLCYNKDYLLKDSLVALDTLNHNGFLALSPDNGL